MTQTVLEQQLEVLAKLREPIRLKLYRYVVGEPAAVSRDQAARAVGISRALAAFHLDKLVEVGLLKSEYRRLSERRGPGAGRPSKLYTRSRHEFQVSLPHREHELLGSFLAASLTEGEGAVAPIQAAWEYGRSLGARARQWERAEPTANRLLECVEVLLERLGFSPYRVDVAVLRLRDCPFDPLSRRFSHIVCGAGVSLTEGIVEGVHAQDLRVARDVHPDRCCVFLRSTVPQRSG